MNVLPWQQDAWQGLVQRRNNNGMPHATLVTGAAGIGKHHLSLVVAQWLLCQKPTNDGACHQCHSCHLWNAGNHPDFILCEPEEGSRQIRIDIIRRVNAFIAQTPQISPCQVVVMRPVEVMNTNAANALLKTLEEPAGESFLLLETERFGSVLPTIRSRCQRLTLGLPPIELALQWLLSQGVVDTDARHALQRCQGAPLKALRWIKEGVGKTEGQLAEQLQQWSTDNLPLEAIASKWVKHEFSELIAWWYQLSCDLHKYIAGIDADQCSDPHQVQALCDGVTVDRHKLIAFQDSLSKLLGQLLSGAAHHNKTLTVEVLLLDWRNIFR